MKPIKMTEEFLEKAAAKFKEDLRKKKVFDGNVTYSTKVAFEATKDERATIFFTLQAYKKMIALVNGFTTEVAWHGTVERGEDKREFFINDVMIYPQYVDGTNVNTDQEEYEKWINGLDDETFNSLRFQGHSHVNMGVTPSGTDDGHEQKILNMLGDDMFYIFVIWNKRGEHMVRIFDLASNTLYETEDVDIYVNGYELSYYNTITEVAEHMIKKGVTIKDINEWVKDMRGHNLSKEDEDAFIKDARENVQNKPVSTWNGYNWGANRNQSGTGNYPAKSKPKHVYGYGYDEYDDFYLNGYGYGK